MYIRIEDVRDKVDFTRISFSGYNKKQVCKEIKKSTMNKNIEDALYWSSELICSGHYLELWETIFQIMCEYIHIGNPKLSIYVHTRFLDFKHIINIQENELDARNNEKIRHIFTEIMYILSYSRKQYAIQAVKVSIDDLDLTKITHLFIADHIHYNKNVFHTTDPKELFIPLNEFTYNLSTTKSSHNCSYWMEWILAFEKQCKKQKTKLTAFKRTHIPVNEVQQNDIIWIIWDIILHAIKDRSPIVKKTVDSLFCLFCVKYTSSIKHKRKLILYYVFLLMCEKIDFSLPVNQSDVAFSEIKSGLPKIYQSIKKHEIIKK